MSALVLDHVRNPRNAGRLDADAPGVFLGQAKGEGEGLDRVAVYLKVEGDRIQETRFRASGCPALIASASLFTDRAKGLSRAEASGITASSLAEALGLPAHQQAKAQLVIEAFVEACTKWDAGEHERSEDPR